MTSEQIARREEAKALVQQSQAATRRHETTRALELSVAAAKVADQATMPEVERALYAAVWSHHEVRRVQLSGVALDAEFDGHGGILVSGEQERSFYDMRLDWMRSEPHGTKSRSAGIGSWLSLASLRTPSRDQEPKEQRAWRRVGSDVEVVLEGDYGEDLRILDGKREVWSTWVQYPTNVMVDPGGRVVVFGATQDISSNEDSAGTYSGTLKFLETYNPERQYDIGELEMLDRDWRDYVAISPAGDTLVYADPKPSTSGQWREPVIINTVHGLLSGARGNAGTVRATLGGHGQSLSSLEYSRDGSRILTLVPGGVLRLWSLDVFVDEPSLASHHGARLGNPYASMEPGNEEATITPSPRMRAFHSDVISGVVTLPGGRGAATASLDGRVVHWPGDGVAPVVLYEDPDHPAVALAHAASSNDDGVYIVTIDGLHRLGLDGHQERLATLEDTYSRRDGSYGSGTTARVVPGLTSEGPLVEIGTGRNFGLVVDATRREVLWKGPCAERPRVDPHLGILSCPRVPDELERHEWPMMLYRSGVRLEEHDPYDPLDPEPQHVEVIPIGDCRRAVIGGALFDFEQRQEIIRFSDIPALQNVKLEGLPVFCSVEDLVGYSQDLLAGVQRPGKPNPNPEASPPSPEELPTPDWAVRPESPDVDPLALVGKLPTVLMQTPWARVALDDLLGEDLPQLESRMEVTSAMERDGDLVIATGCMAHFCTMEEMALVIEIPTARIHAAILTCPQRIKVYSPKGTRTPAKLESMVAEMRGYADAECE